MVELTKKVGGPTEMRVRRKRRRRRGDLKKNLLWAGIILIVTLILGALVGSSSNLFDRYFSTEDESAQSAIPKDVTKKLRDLDIDKLLREKERMKR